MARARIDTIAWWKCHAKPAALGGATCGHVNVSGGIVFRGLVCCAACGATKVASDARAPKCPHCSKPCAANGATHGITCGASECQEAEYHANRERNASARKKRSR